MNLLLLATLLSCGTVMAIPWITYDYYGSHVDTYGDTYGEPRVDTYGDPHVDTYGIPHVDTYVDPHVDMYVDQDVDILIHEDECELTLTKDGGAIADGSYVTAISGCLNQVHCQAYCSGSGATPALTFEKNGRPVSQLVGRVYFVRTTLDQNAVLNVQNMQARDEGRYTCKGWFLGVGYKEKSFHLTFEPRTPTADLWSGCRLILIKDGERIPDGAYVRVESGELNRISCEPSCNGRGASRALYFIKGQRRVSEMIQRVYFVRESIDRRIVLNIYHALPSDRGWYTCSGWIHGIGHKEASFNLVFTCPTGFTACDSTRCICDDKLCDNVQDCDDGTDEANCDCDPISTTTTPTTTTTTPTTTTTTPTTTTTTPTTTTTTPTTTTTTPTTTTTTPTTTTTTPTTTTATPTTTNTTPIRTTTTPTTTTTTPTTTTTTPTTTTTTTTTTIATPTTTTTNPTTTTTPTPSTTTTTTTTTPTTTTTTPTTTTTAPTTTTTTSGCASDNFRCGDSTCISMSQVCDSNPDCYPGGEDEKDCPGPPCSEGKRRCADGSGCYLGNERCDGVAQCQNREDEQNCGWRVEQSSPSILLID